RDALVPSESDEVMFLPAGRRPEGPDLIRPKGMQELTEQLRQHCDFVIMDSSPVLVVADTLPLVPLADGVLLVVDAATTSRATIERARSQVNQIGGEVVGTILNRFDPSKARDRGAAEAYGLQREYQAYSRPSAKDAGSEIPSPNGQVAVPELQRQEETVVVVPGDASIHPGPRPPDRPDVEL